MVFGWLKGSKDDSVDELISRKEFGRAIEILEKQLEKTPRDRRLRQQLADCMAGSGRKEDAIGQLSTLADEYACDGFVAKAIAVLKKIQKLDPGRTDVENRIADLLEESSISVSSTSSVDSIEEDVSEIGFEDIGFEPVDVASPEEGAAVTEPTGEGVAEEPSSPGEELPEPEEATSDAAPVVEETIRWREIAATPLFADFTKDELIAVIRGLELRTFDDGDIVVTEGEPGDSLFVLTTGRVKVFTRNPQGKHVHLAELGEGDFFGEVAVLTGRPRTATITAASDCEALELDNRSLGEITGAHPRVREVLESFYEQRAKNTVEAMISSLRDD